MEWFANLLRHYPELAIFLTLAFGEAVRAPKRVAGDKSAAADKNGRHHTDAAEAALNVGQRLEFHFSNDWFE